jgi:hypothetical protein
MGPSAPKRERAGRIRACRPGEVMQATGVRSPASLFVCSLQSISPSVRGSSLARANTIGIAASTSTANSTSTSSSRRSTVVSTIIAPPRPAETSSFSSTTSPISSTASSPRSAHQRVRRHRVARRTHRVRGLVGALCGGRPPPAGDRDRHLGQRGRVRSRLADPGACVVRGLGRARGGNGGPRRATSAILTKSGISCAREAAECGRRRCMDDKQKRAGVRRAWMRRLPRPETNCRVARDGDVVNLIRGSGRGLGPLRRIR